MPEPKRVSTRWNLRRALLKFLTPQEKVSDAGFSLPHVPARHLDDAVVQGRLEAGRRRARHTVSDRDQILAQ